MIQYKYSDLIKYGGIVHPLFAMQTVEESGDTYSSPLKVLPFATGMFFLRCEALSGGGSKELDVRIRTKDPAGDYWYTLIHFSSLFAAGGDMKWPFLIPLLGEKISVVYDLTDITSVRFAVNAVLRITR